MGPEADTRSAEEELTAYIRKEIEAGGHSTVTWGRFGRMAGLSEDGARGWAEEFCARPGVGLRAVLHGGGVAFWPDGSGEHLSALVPATGGAG